MTQRTARLRPSADAIGSEEDRMDELEAAEFSEAGRSRKPWLGFYAACALLIGFGGFAWGVFTYISETSTATCELRGTAASPAGVFNVYECPDGGAYIVRAEAAARLVPLPRREE